MTWIVTIDKPHIYEQGFTTWANKEDAMYFYKELITAHIGPNNNDVKICLCKVQEFSERKSVGV